MAESVSGLGRRAAEKLRLPPHSVEAERSVLGGLMLDHGAWDQVADAVEAEDFYRADHRLIFATIAMLVERDQPPDAITVSEALDRQGDLEAAGGLEYLAQLVEETPSAANIAAYARIIRERAMLRQLIRIGGDIATSAHEEGSRTVEELVDLAEQRVFEIADRGQRRGAGFVALKHILPKTIDRLDVLSHSEGDITGVSSGFTDMDRMTAGLQRGDLIIVAGRPSMGKCIVAGSRILDPATGRLVAIEDRVRARHADLVALDRDGRLRPTRASAFVDDGIKPVYEVRTAVGRRIVVTASHPFLTRSGWRPLGALKAGVAIGVPRTLPFFGRRPLPERFVKLAAYLLSGERSTGSARTRSSAHARIRAGLLDAVRRISRSRARAEAGGGARPRNRAFPLAALADALGLLPAAASRRAVAACAASAPLPEPFGALNRGSVGPVEAGGQASKRGERSAFGRLAEIAGLLGVAAQRRRVPDLIFELPREQLALFVNRAYALDGSLRLRDSDHVAIVYSTVSEQLARDMQHLLLRFGIVARLRFDRLRRSEGLQPATHELLVIDREDVARFFREIGRFCDGAAGADRAPRLARPASPALDAAAPRSDVYWDRIEEIRYIGPRQVYDLTVPEHHNFVAEDVIVHNTTFAMNVAENAAIGAEVPTAIFSMEMSAEQLSFRMIGSIGRVNQSHLRTGRLTDEDWSRIESAVTMMSGAPIFIDDSAGLTPTDVRARARRLKREHGLGLVVVDYLQLMQVSGTVENRATEISEISRSLKALAKELDVPVIALSQLNRSVESRTDKKPVMSDLRESGAIEQDADLIVFIYREEVYEPDTPRKGIADIIIGKQRNGPVGEFRLTFLGEFTKFENLVAEAYGEGVY